MYLLKLFIILALILFPFGEFLRFDVANNIAIKPLDIVVVICAACFIFINKQKFKYNKFLFILFPVIGLCALLLSLKWLSIVQLLTSFLYLVRWISYTLLLPIVLHFDKKFRAKISLLLLFDGVIFLIFGFIQYYFYNSLRNLYYLGWDEHMHRIFSTFFDPNFAGSFLVLFLIFVGGLIFNFLQKKKYKVSIILGLLAGITLIAVFLTFSRAAILMLIVGTITFFILIRKKKLIMIFLIAIILFFLADSSKFYDENMNLLREASNQARLANYEVAIKVITDHPLIGVGFDSYRYTKNLYGLNHDWTSAPSHADAGVDNSFLFVLATTGILGFIAYLGLWVVILKRAFYLYKQKHVGAVVVIASTFALFTNALFINSLFFAPLMLWMWIIIGLMED